MNARPSPQKEDWSNPERYSPHWTARAECAVSMLDASTMAVCDIGCGAPQDVRSLLPRNIRYLPADLHCWTADTEYCDLEKKIFPEKSLAACDTALMLGVIEYMQDAAGVFAGLALRCPRLVTSYHPFDLQPERYPTWVNQFSEDVYLRMLEQARWMLEKRIGIEHGQVLYRFFRKPD